MTRTKLIFLGLFSISLVLIGVILFKRFFVKIEPFYSSTPGTATCPTDFKMYMYEGTAYCCKGTINRDATSVEKTCLPPVTSMENSFCTLNDKQGKIPNCTSLLGGNLSIQAGNICPASKPNFCNANRCCASSVTSDYSDCSDKSLGYCDANIDMFKTLPGGKTSCQYQRIKEMDRCPAGTTMNDITPGGILAGTTIYGCATLTSTCYTSVLLNALKAAGKDTTGLVSCQDAGAAAAARAAEATVNSFTS